MTIAPATLSEMIASTRFEEVRKAVVTELARLLKGVTVVGHPGKLDMNDVLAKSVVAAPGVAVGWGRLRPLDDEEARAGSLTRASAVALYLRDNLEHWRILAGGQVVKLSDAALRVEEHLKTKGASFAAAIARACGLLPAQLEHVLGELVAAGRISSDNFSGLRDLVADAQAKAKRARAKSLIDRAGRWSPLESRTEVSEVERWAAVEAQARAILVRYGVVSRKVIEREALLAPWRDLLRVLRRMEARGEVRGGYFVTGMSGEQYALPEALALLRRHRETPETPVYVALSAADPLNFTGSIIPGERIPASATHRVLFRDALPVAVYDGRAMRVLDDLTLSPEVERLLIQSPRTHARRGATGPFASRT